MLAPRALRRRLGGGATVKPLPVEEQGGFLWWCICFLFTQTQKNDLVSDRWSIRADREPWQEVWATGVSLPLPQWHHTGYYLIIYFIPVLQVQYLTCVSSSVLRFSRWMSHGSDEWSGWKGRSFGSWLLLVATMVMGGWQREREARWASSDRWSTEAPPTSCQNKNTIKPEWEKIFVVIVEAPTAVCFCVISRTLLWVFSAQSNQVTFDLKAKAKKWWALISQNTVPWD